jgi:hypothetical protein
VSALHREVAVSEKQIYIHAPSGNRYIIRRETRDQICLEAVFAPGRTLWVSRQEFQQKFNVGRETWEA